MIIKVTPNKKRAQSILSMIDTTLEMTNQIDKKFTSNLTKEYYDCIREALTIIMLMDGYKTYGERAHKEAIEYLGQSYQEFTKKEIIFIDTMRDLRNKVYYEGFKINQDYLDRNNNRILEIINKLKTIIKSKF